MRKLRAIICLCLSMGIILSSIFAPAFARSGDLKSQSSSNPVFYSKIDVQSEKSLNPSENKNIKDENSADEDDLATNRFIIKYKNDKVKTKVSRILANKISKNRKITGKGNFDVITTRSKMKKGDLLNEIKSKNAEDDIEYIQPDYKICLSTNDTYFSSQWGVCDSVYGSVYGGSSYSYDAGVVGAWEVSTGSGVIVAVIDTGIDIEHEDLSANIWTNAGEIPGNGIDDDNNGYIDDVHGWDFCENDNLVHNPGTLNDERHGTHVAGIIAAVKDNFKGIAGVAPDTKIMPLKAFTGGTAYTSEIIEAVEYAKQMGAKIINCSWGTTVSNPALKDTIENSGMLFVCAAGNSGVNIDTIPVYPASYNLPNIISVASINKDGNLSVFSNYGQYSVDVAAPGEGIISALPNNSYGLMSGTSMAAPLVTGEAALILSKHNNFTAEDIKNNILLSSDNIPALNGKVYSNNKIDCYNAICGLPNSEIAINDRNGTVPDSIYQASYENTSSFELYADYDFNAPKKVFLDNAQAWVGFNNTQFSTIEYASIPNWGSVNNAICGTATLICNNSELQFYPTNLFVDNGKAQIALGYDGRLWVAIPKGKIGNGTGYTDDLSGFINYLANKGTVLFFQQAILQSSALNKMLAWEGFNNTTFGTIEFMSIPNWASSNNAISGTTALTCYNSDIAFVPTLGFVDNGNPQIALGSDGRLWIAIPKGKLGGSTGYSDDLAGFMNYITDKGTILVYQQATIKSAILNNTLSWQGFNNTQFSSIEYASIPNWAITNSAISNTIDLTCNSSELQFTPVWCFLDNGKAQVAVGNDGRLWVAIPKGKIGNGSGYSDDLTGFKNYLTDKGTALLYQRANLKTAILNNTLPWEIFNNTTFSTIEFMSVPNWASSNNAISGTASLICSNSDNLYGSSFSPSR